MFSIMDEADIRIYPNKKQTVRTYCCLSLDDKPTNDITNGSTCLEMDTRKVYIFDEQNTLWREL